MRIKVLIWLKCVLALLSWTIAASAQAAEQKQIWACAAAGAQEEDLWLVAGGEKSYIKLYDSRIWDTTHYQQDGAMHWGFVSRRDGVYRYSVILNEDNTAIYTDFGETASAKASEFKYNCRKAQ